MEEQYHQWKRWFCFHFYFIDKLKEFDTACDGQKIEIMKTPNDFTTEMHRHFLVRNICSTVHKYLLCIPFETYIRKIRSNSTWKSLALPLVISTWVKTIQRIKVLKMYSRLTLRGIPI